MQGVGTIHALDYMDRETVYGSGMVSIGFDTKKQVMEIEWQRGTYQYAVPEYLYEELMAAHEKTTFFNQRIRGKFQTRKLE